MDGLAQPHKLYSHILFYKFNSNLARSSLGYLRTLKFFETFKQREENTHNYFASSRLGKKKVKGLVKNNLRHLGVENQKT